MNLVNVESLAKMPWTRVGPTRVEAPEGAYFEIRIEELPDFFVASSTPEEAVSELSDALKAFLLSYLERGALPPLPEPKWQIVVGEWHRLPGPDELPDLDTTDGPSTVAVLVSQTCPEP